jgi:hypothetical protein
MIMIILYLRHDNDSKSKSLISSTGTSSKIIHPSEDISLVSFCK